MLNRRTIKPWLICGCGALFFFYQFMQLSLFDTLSQPLMDEFSLSQSKLASISSTYLWALVICYIPIGYMFDRLSNKRLIVLALIASIIAVFSLYFVQQAWQLQAIRAVTGITHCFAFLGCMRLAGQWLSHRLSLAMGINFTVGFLGGVIAHTPFAMITAHYGWRYAILPNGLLGVVILLMIGIFVSDYPIKPTHASFSEEKLRQHFKTIILNKQNWLCSFYNMLLNLPVIMFAALWGTLYLIREVNLTAIQASAVMTMVFNGAIVGSPAFGWLSEKMQSRRYPMIISAYMALLTSLLIFWWPSQTYIHLIILYFILGFSTGGQVVSYSSITESNSSHIRGLALSITSIIILGGGGLSQDVFGYILDFNWRAWLPNISYSPYQLAYFLLPVGFAICSVMSLKVRETFPYSVTLNDVPSKAIDG